MKETGSVVFSNDKERSVFVIWKAAEGPASSVEWIVFPIVSATGGRGEYSVYLDSSDPGFPKTGLAEICMVKVDWMRTVPESRLSDPVGRVSPEKMAEIQVKLRDFLFRRQPAADNLPFTLHDIGREEVGEAVDAFSSTWITAGPKIVTFEKEFAEFVGARHALAVTSCTAALHLALDAVGIKKGHVVLTSPYTVTATAEVVHCLGADPLFVDIRPDTFNINEDLLEETIQQIQSGGRHVAAIIPAHFAGQACEMEKILEVAGRHGIRVVEDATQALPCTSAGKKVGTIGDVTVFSSYAAKTIATGEGGMITTDDDSLARRMRVIRQHGFSRDVWDSYNSEQPFRHYCDLIDAGYMYNLNDIASAIGIQQLKRAPAFQKRRSEIAGRYTRAFSDLPAQVPITLHSDDIRSWHIYPLLLNLKDLSIGRDRFIELMAEAGVGTSVHFIPVHIHPYWRNRYGFRPEEFPVALSAYQREVSLPIFAPMTDKDVELIIGTVRQILSRHIR